jgi:hypothetical protein
MGQSTSVAILVVVAFAVSCSAASVELFQRFPNLNPRQLSNATDVTACKPLASTFFEVRLSVETGHILSICLTDPATECP